MLQAEEIELNLPSFPLGHARKSLLNLKYAHDGKMECDSAWSSERFCRLNSDTIGKKGSDRGVWG